MVDRRKTPAFCGFAAIVAVLALHVHAASAVIDLTYCSSQNTGSDGGATYWTWQSNGWCGDHCRANYAFSIVNGNDCYCSNYAPADQLSVGDCNEGCPGFPDEKCGNAQGNVFGYVKLDREASGTQGASQPSSTQVSPSSTPAPQPSSSSPPEPSSETPEPETSTSEQNDPTTSAAPAPSTTFKTKTSEASEAPMSTKQDEPVTNTEIVTISGSQVIRTIIITPTPADPVNEKPESQNKSSNNTGPIVGGVVGGIAGIAAIVGGIFFLLWRRKKQQRQAADDDDPAGIQRNVSTMSKAGLLRSSEKNGPSYPTPIATNVRRNSRMMGDDSSISPISGSDRRNSRPFMFDQRLNPSAVMMNFDNTSRGSFNSIDDSRDYGRTLNVRNPDPDPH